MTPATGSDCLTAPLSGVRRLPDNCARQGHPPSLQMRKVMVRRMGQNRISTRIP